MEHEKIGRLICKLRKEKKLTQLQLAEQMNISDKAVSKWERGLGCPDISLLPELSKIFNVDLGNLLSGEMDGREVLGGNMKRTVFYICPICGNMLNAMDGAGVSCCGKKLSPLQPQKAAEGEELKVEIIENDYYITTDHPMTREHYIPFVALLTTDSIMIRKRYPEWDLAVRIPMFSRGRLLWYCTRHGLFYQDT